MSAQHVMLAINRLNMEKMEHNLDHLNGSIIWSIMQ